MRISDWSSDVCSSDLGDVAIGVSLCYILSKRNIPYEIINTDDLESDTKQDITHYITQDKQDTKQDMKQDIKQDTEQDIKQDTIHKTTYPDRKKTRLNSSH